VGAADVIKRDLGIRHAGFVAVSGFEHRIRRDFRQLFEPQSSAYTYLIGCEEAGTAALIDPVLGTVERDLKFARAWLQREMGAAPAG